MRRVIVPVIADTHAGHRLALLNPETMLFEIDHNGEVKPKPFELTESQLMEWEHYTNTVQKLSTLAGDDEVIGIHDGDLTWGLKYPNQLVSTRLSDQMLIAEMNLLPLMQMKQLKKFRFLAGTDSHAMNETASEIEACRNLQLRYPDKSINIIYHGLMEIDGVLIDVAHHGPFPGSRQWFRGDDMRRYVRNICFQEFADGRRPPDVIIRAHYHEYHQEIVPINGHKVIMILCPSYSMMTQHARQVSRSSHKIHIGMFALEISDGKVQDVHEYIERFDLRSKESL